MAADISFVQATGDNSDSATYTFAAHPIGAADASRIVVVGVSMRASGTTLDATSVTVGGSAATLIAKQRRGSTVTNILAVYAIAVAAGTTATVVVNANTASLRCGISVYRVVGAKLPASANAVDSNVDLAVSLPVLADGCAVAFAMSGNPAAVGTWSGLTERSDLVVEFIGTTSASDNVASSDPSKAISLTWPSSSEPCLIAVAFEKLGGGIIPIIRQHYAAQGAR
jgi:hypothetical protein